MDGALREVVPSQPAHIACDICLLAVARQHWRFYGWRRETIYMSCIQRGLCTYCVVRVCVVRVCVVRLSVRVCVCVFIYYVMYQGGGGGEVGMSECMLHVLFAVFEGVRFAWV
jgi:hypothetical protein